MSLSFIEHYFLSFRSETTSGLLSSGLVIIGKIDKVLHFMKKIAVKGVPRRLGCLACLIFMVVALYSKSYSMIGDTLPSFRLLEITELQVQQTYVI